MNSFGPKRQFNETTSDFRLRMAKFSWRWVPASVLILIATIYALKHDLGQGALWMSVVFVMLLSGFALVMASLAGIGFSIGAGWARRCEDSITLNARWNRVKFIATTLVLLPVWLSAGYWVGRAILLQETLVGPRMHTHVAAFADEPQAFLFYTGLWITAVLTLPFYWMRSAKARFSSSATS
ncbi:MAG: hypothetical protein ACREPQ_15585 [Rhodanobacter sp.]